MKIFKFVLLVFAITEIILGQNWVAAGLEGKSILCIAVDPINTGKIYVGVKDEGVYVSNDSGSTWLCSSKRISIYCLTIDRFNNQIIYAGADNEILISRDGGNYFKNIWTFTNISVNCIKLDETQTKAIIIGTTKGLYKSFDNGGKFIKSGLEDQSISAIAINNKGTKAIIYAATFGAGIFKSGNYGLSWTPINNGINDLTIYTIICDMKDPSKLYAGTLETGLIYSDNNGGKWVDLNIDIISKQGFVIFQSTDLKTNVSSIFIANFAGDILVSKDAGMTWKKLSTGSSVHSCTALGISNVIPSNLFLGTIDGLFKFKVNL